MELILVPIIIALVLSIPLFGEDVYKFIASIRIKIYREKFEERMHEKLDWALNKRVPRDGIKVLQIIAEDIMSNGFFEKGYCTRCGREKALGNKWGYNLCNSCDDIVSGLS